MEYTTKVVELFEVAQGVIGFRLKKPDNFVHRPGQWCLVRLPDRGFSDERGLSRPLSIASSPTEDLLLFATRISGSAFKRTLEKLLPGDEVRIGQSQGTMILYDEIDMPIVMIAGGVGITPFRSMVRYAVDMQWSHPIALFYSNKTPEETAFLGEFQIWEKRLPSFVFIPTMTKVNVESSNWKGITGRISAEMIRSYFTYWQDAMYFIAGPPAMVTFTEEMLMEMGIDKRRISLERLSGS